MHQYFVTLEEEAVAVVAVFSRKFLEVEACHVLVVQARALKQAPELAFGQQVWPASDHVPTVDSKTLTRLNCEKLGMSKLFLLLLLWASMPCLGHCHFLPSEGKESSMDLQEPPLGQLSQEPSVEHLYGKMLVLVASPHLLMHTRFDLEISA